MLFFLFLSTTSSKQSKPSFYVISIIHDISFNMVEEMCDLLMIVVYFFPTVVTKTITVVQTVVDGRVVESSKTVGVDVDEIKWCTRWIIENQ